MTATLTLTLERRPWTLNVERQGNRWKRSALVKEWRAEFARLAAGPHRFESVHITVRPHLRNRSGMPDTGACIGAAKAAIDGLVDAGVIVEDGPKVVQRLIFEAPVVTGVDALVITVVDAEVAALIDLCPGREAHLDLAQRAHRAEAMADASDIRCAEAITEAGRLGRELDEARQYLLGPRR